MVWLLLGLLLVASAMISGSETALFALSRGTLAEFRHSPSPLKRSAAFLMERPREALLTVLLANVVVNTAIFALAFIAAERLGDYHAGLRAGASAGVLLSVILFAELMPKAVALANPRRWAPPAGALVSVLQWILGPIISVLGALIVNPLTRLLAPSRRGTEALNRDELESLLQLSARDGVIDSRENQMLLSAVALAETRVREVMTPRVDLKSIPLSAEPATARRIAREARRRSLLVHGADLDDIRGIVQTRDLFLEPLVPLSKLIRPVHYVPEQVNLVQLTRHFRQKKLDSAVVVDEYGGTAGVVSLVDVARHIVGDLPEEGATRSVEIEELEDGSFRVSGDLSVRLWASRFGVQEIDGHIDTVAGLILSRLGHMPRSGDGVTIGNLRLTVESVERRRIASVLLRRDAAEPAKAESAG